MNPTEKIGSIVTFYSFKGGVGRTMALANVAFLTAMNGKRVLVMDWDLEAPGLAYYFHGLLDSHASKALENSPGILDILYQWQTGVAKAGDQPELEALQHQFEQGEPFQNCVRNLIEPAMLKTHFPDGACLDIIGPGAKTIRAFANQPYEEALAQFSWSDFFEKRAGGFALDQFRRWAKKNYDFVLIDSRTGLADIAGICTMQIPDTVALCFVLNQQNIDGIAKVAAAIHVKRPGEIEIRAVPMRVSQKESAESSDAQARALSALRRATGANADTISKDMSRLAIPMVDNLPFSEILSPFAAKDPRFDVLALSYLQLTHNLLDSSLVTLAISDELIQQVKHRRLPKTATVEYVMSLVEAEPLRAYEELGQLIESAEQTVSGGAELEEEYLTALIKVSCKKFADDEFNEVDGIDIDDIDKISTHRILKLLNAIQILYKRNPVQWNAVLIAAIIAILKFATVNDYENEIDTKYLREGLDDLLTPATDQAEQLQRLTNLENLAQIYLEESNEAKLLTTTNDIFGLIEKFREVANTSQTELAIYLLEANSRTCLRLGKWYSRIANVNSAKKYFQDGLVQLTPLTPETANATLHNLTFSLHRQLAHLPALPRVEVMHHAIEAARWGKFNRKDFIYFATVLLTEPWQPTLILDFCQNVFGRLETVRKRFLQNQLSSESPISLAFIKVNAQLATFLIDQSGDTAQRILFSLIRMVQDEIAMPLMQRSQHISIAPKIKKQLAIELVEFIHILEDADISLDNYPQLIEAAKKFSATMPEDSAENNDDLP